MNKHYRASLLKQNISMQINKYSNDRYELGLNLKLDRTNKCFLVVLSIGLYKCFMMAYKKV